MLKAAFLEHPEILVGRTSVCEHALAMKCAYAAAWVESLLPPAEIFEQGVLDTGTTLKRLRNGPPGHGSVFDPRAEVAICDRADLQAANHGKPIFVLVTIRLSDHNVSFRYVLDVSQIYQSSEPN
ncbi:MAG: hypothetical protein WEB52_03185 [Dehalococcoidia bacterium]